MKKLLPFLTAAVAACQQQAPPATSVAQQPASRPLPVATSAQPLDAADSLAAEAAAMLRQHDLSPLWAKQTESTKAYPTLEGFYGPDYYRISFYFSKVTRDAQRPNVFHVEGLDR